MANWPISIAVLNATGDMAYSVSVQHASAGDTVTWSSESGPFTLTFGGSSPFTEGLQLQSNGGAAAPYTVNGTVRAGAAVGRYYYGVSAVYNANGRVYTDPGCPEIIIK